VKTWVPALTPEIEALTDLPNPAYEKELRLVQRGQKHRFDHRIDDRIILWDKAIGPGYLVPFGCAPDERSQRLFDVPDWLRPYQREAVEAVLPYRHGVIEAPCGSGKTQMGCAIIAAYKGRGRCLVLVHTQDLVAQWVARLKAVLGVTAAKATGSAAWAKMLAGVEQWLVVTTVQTLGRQAEMGEWDVVILDEAHHCPASTYTALLARLGFRRIYGLTATPEREDGMGAAMLAWLGPIRYKVDRARLVELGQTMTPAVCRVDSGAWTEASEYTDMVTELSTIGERNALIWRMAMAHGAWPQVMLTLRVEHAEALGAMAPEGVKVEVVTGKGKQRAEALARVAAGESHVLIATQLADEGLDLPELTACHLTLPSRAAGRTEQRVGRIMRPSAGKGTPVVYDYVDDDSLCLAQWRARVKVYRSLGVTKWRHVKVEGEAK
jgi:superfamily II DNA or RNA helicase